jgi:hypothetical protein
MTERLVLPYTVTARRNGDEPIRIGILARGPADAITTAQELFPEHIISTALLHPDWDDDFA